MNNDNSVGCAFLLEMLIVLVISAIMMFSIVTSINNCYKAIDGLQEELSEVEEVCENLLQTYETYADIGDAIQY